MFEPTTKKEVPKDYQMLHADYDETTGRVVIYHKDFITSVDSPEQLWDLFKLHRRRALGKEPLALGQEPSQRAEAQHAIFAYLQDNDPTYVPPVTMEENIKRMQEAARVKRLAKAEEKLEEMGLTDLFEKIKL